MMICIMSTTTLTHHISLVLLSLFFPALIVKGTSVIYFVSYLFQLGMAILLRPAPTRAGIPCPVEVTRWLRVT